MAQPVRIKIDTSRYASPDETDVTEAKQYARKRNEAILALIAALRQLIDDCTERMVDIMYRSGLSGEQLSIDNLEDELSMELADLLDALQENVSNTIRASILKIPFLDTNTTQNYLTILTSYLTSLGHGNKDFNGTMFTYMWRYARDVEAYVAATKYSGLSAKEALPKILGSIGHKGSPTLVNELKDAYSNAERMSALYINSRGEVTDYDGGKNIQGIPRDGAMAMLNSANIAMAMVWGRAQLLSFIDSGAVGYYQLRGSAYPCAVCDDEVGFHPGDLRDAPSLPHPHCMCYRVPIYNNTQYRPLSFAMANI